MSRDMSKLVVAFNKIYEQPKRIPLQERIKKAQKTEANFLKVFELFSDDYFIALATISHDLYFADRYEKFIGKRMHCKSDLMSKCIHFLDTLPEEARERLLYYMLIEPFAKIPVFERSVEE